MKTLLFAALLISAGLLCAEDVAPVVDAAAAKVFLNKTVEYLQTAKPDPQAYRPIYVLKSDTKTEDPNEKAVLAWLTAEILKTSEKHVIKEKRTYGFTFRIEKVMDIGKYAITMYQQSNPKTPLDPKKIYLAFHFTGVQIACPEWHGLIDPDGPTLLMFAHDAGG